MYGGTKAELERLVDDAEKLTGQALDPSKFSDVITAIHAVQENMGITGTTAREAATTIEGSVNTMKASWENFLTGLGNENADIDQLTDQLLASIGTVIENVAPRLGEIAGTLVMQIIARGPEIASALGTMLQNGIQGAFDLAAGIVGENTIAPTVDWSGLTSGLNGAIGAIQGAFTSLSSAWSVILGPAQQVVSTILSSLGPALETLGSIAQQYLLPALQSLGPVFANLLIAIQPWIQPLMNVATIIGGVVVGAITLFVNVLGMIVSGITNVINWLTTFATWLGTIPSQVSAFVTNVITFFSQLPGQIASFLLSIITNIISWASQMATNAWNAATNFVSGIINTISQLPGQFLTFLNTIITNILTFASNMATEAMNAATNFASNLIDGLAAIPGQVVSIGSDIIGGIVNGITGAAGSVVDAVTGAVGGAIEAAKKFLGIASPSKVFRDEVGQWIPKGLSVGIDEYSNIPVRSVEDMSASMVSTAQDVKPPTYTVQSRDVSSDALIDEVKALRDELSNLKIYLDGKTLVGGIAGEMDKQLGRRAAWSATR